LPRNTGVSNLSFINQNLQENEGITNGLALPPSKASKNVPSAKLEQDLAGVGKALIFPGIYSN